MIAVVLAAGMALTAIATATGVVMSRAYGNEVGRLRKAISRMLGVADYAKRHCATDNPVFKSINKIVEMGEAALDGRKEDAI